MLIKNKSLLVILFIFITVICLAAQELGQSTVAGKIVDAETSEPLAKVNIFFVNTTIGTASGPDGNFVLKNIPNGAYDLMFNHVGYKLYSVPIQFLKSDSQYFEIKLTPEVYKTDEIKVEADEPKEWRKNLKEFTRLFLGKTDNAKKCELLNPEVLEFRMNEERGEFFAETDSVLKVRNEALGYQVEVILNHFKYEEETDAVQYTIFPKFTELEPKDEKQEKKWHELRQESYEGSLKHFISSLARDNLKNDRFEIYHTMDFHLKGYKILPREKGFLVTDSLGLKRLQFEKLFSVYHKPGKDIIYDTWLDAVYKETEKSYIKLNTPYILIDDYGNIFANFPISVYGEWSRLGVADLLPFNYMPELN